MTDAIKPPWAISVWCNADHIYAELPAIGGQTAHVVRVKNDGMGLGKILTLAKSRDISSRIGSRGDPTQHQINKIDYDPAMIKRARPKLVFSSAQRIEARSVLRKMGLI